MEAAAATAGFLAVCGVAALAPNVKRPFELSAAAAPKRDEAGRAVVRHV